MIKNTRTSLDLYDVRPKEMTSYLLYNGWHFNKKACELAISYMYKNNKPINPISKDNTDQILLKYNVVLDNNYLWDYIYVANMCKADFYNSSIKDEEHLAKYIKDVIDDEDAYDGIIFNRWYADMCKKGIPIDWEAIL